MTNQVPSTLPETPIVGLYIALFGSVIIAIVGGMMLASADYIKGAAFFIIGISAGAYCTLRIISKK